MEMIVSILAFTTIFCIITETILSSSIFIIFSQLNKVIDQAQSIISDVNFRRSTGKPLPISELNFIQESSKSWALGCSKTRSDLF